MTIFRNEAIKQAFNYEELHTALAFLIQAQEFDEAIKFTRLRLDHLDGGQYRHLRLAVEIFSKINASVATLLYREMLETTVVATKSAKDLVILIKISVVIN